MTRPEIERKARNLVMPCGHTKFYMDSFYLCSLCFAETGRQLTAKDEIIRGLAGALEFYAKCGGGRAKEALSTIPPEIWKKGD